MIEAFVAEIASKEIGSSLKDIPTFVKDLNATEVLNYAEADKPLYEQEMSKKNITDLNRITGDLSEVQVYKQLQELYPERQRHTVIDEAYFPIVRIETINDHLEGTVHPETGIPFEAKVIELTDGTRIEGVFPQFDSIFDVQLPENMYLDTDYRQFSYANQQLKEAIQQNPELAKRFNALQLEQIKEGETPDGFTWHHSEEVGKLQLVDERIHALTGHTGGRNIWGGGSLHR
jgi:hypothetical protein